ncbi:nitronate monooxygenase [Geminicoccaceae bacterium 1502E]|nr:nitronate monooxygenase [Geminicoccaceae bacterium 1502E]
MREQLFSTRLTELFGIRHPILMGGLFQLADARFVAAAVNAGCMGFITAATFPDPERFREELRRCSELTGGRPFGVNLAISRQDEGGRRLLDHLRVLLEEGVRFVETSGGSPSEILPALKEGGVRVMHKVPAVRYAVSTARNPMIDAVCVVGAECGGHPGVYMIGSMVQAADAPARIDKPVAIGGGIGTGRQLTATLAMGADAVLMGTRFLVAEEIWAHRDIKERIVAGDGTDSTVVMQIFRRHHRVLDNEAAQEVRKLELAGVTDFAAYEPHVAGRRVREAYETGDLSKGMIDYGQGACFADAIEPLETIVDRIIDDAAAARRRLAELAPA